jgi:hypothetical protein
MSTWMGSTVAAVWARSGAYNQPDECSDHDEHPHDDGEADLDAYIARLATAAPPLSVLIGDGFGTWQALVPEPNGETVVVRHTLGELLDRLTELLVEGGG